MKRVLLISGMALWLLSCSNRDTENGPGTATGPGTGAAPAGGAATGTNAGTGGAGTNADSVSSKQR